MTRLDSAEIVGILQTAYPDTFKSMSDEAVENYINLFARCFMQDDRRIVETAIFLYINTHDDRFAPNIGQIRQEIYSITSADSMTGADAWSLVTAAVKNSTYNSQEEFAKLPPLVRKAIGSASVLREYASMDSETFQSVTQSNFLRAYRTMESRAAEDAKTPPAVRAYIASTLKPLPEIEAPKPDKDAVIREVREQIIAAQPPKKPEEHGEITEEAKAAAIAKARAYMEGRTFGK